MDGRRYQYAHVWVLGYRCLYIYRVPTFAIYLRVDWLKVSEDGVWKPEIHGEEDEAVVFDLNSVLNTDLIRRVANFTINGGAHAFI